MNPNLLLIIERHSEGDLPIFDFQYAIINAARYMKWHDPKWVFEVALRTIEDISKFKSIHKNLDVVLPVGSVEFIEAIIAKQYKHKPKPINVPRCLMLPEYSGREIRVENYPVFTEGNFYKDMDRVKGVSGFLESDFSSVITTTKVLPGNFQVAPKVNIDSEWRCFVHRNELLDAKCYAGDFRTSPDWPSVEVMINQIKSSEELNSGTYALDVFVNESGTYCMEAHEFWSVGTYGFESPKLIQMMKTGLRDAFENSKRQEKNG